MDANQNSRKAVLLVLAVFVLGLALGSVGTYVVSARVHAARPQLGLSRNPAGVMAMFTHDLDLSPDQQTQVQAIFNDMRAQYASLHQKLDPEYEQVRQHGRERIREILTPEQKPKFEDLLRRLDEERRRHQAEAGH